MPLTTTVSNRYKYELIKDIATHIVKAILMSPSFTFNPDSHNFLDDVTASQLATGNGYTQDNKALTGATVTRDDATDSTYISWDDLLWTASGGSIGPFGSLVFIDVTLTDSPIMGCIDFGLDENNQQITVTIAENTSWIGKSLKFYAVNGMVNS